MWQLFSFHFFLAIHKLNFPGVLVKKMALQSQDHHCVHFCSVLAFRLVVCFALIHQSGCRDQNPDRDTQGIISGCKQTELESGSRCRSSQKLGGSVLHRTQAFGGGLRGTGSGQDWSREGRQERSGLNGGQRG